MKVNLRAGKFIELKFDQDMEREVLMTLIAEADQYLDDLLNERFQPQVDDEEVFEEWQEWVKPDLQEEFRGQLDSVKKALREQPSKLRIEVEHFDLWYGALNQARLVLHMRHQFAGVDDVGEVMSWDEGKREAFMRFQYALALQGALLDAMP